MVGFAAGVPSVGGFYRRFARRHGPAAALAAAPRLVRPSRGPPPAGDRPLPGRRERPAVPLPDAELLSIAVAPGWPGRRHRPRPGRRRPRRPGRPGRRRHQGRGRRGQRRAPTASTPRSASARPASSPSIREPRATSGSGHAVLRRHRPRPRPDLGRPLARSRHRAGRPSPGRRAPAGRTSSRSTPPPSPSWAGSGWSPPSSAPCCAHRGRAAGLVVAGVVMATAVGLVDDARPRPAWSGWWPDRGRGADRRRPALRPARARWPCRPGSGWSCSWC